MCLRSGEKVQSCLWAGQGGCQAEREGCEGTRPVDCGLEMVVLVETGVVHRTVKTQTLAENPSSVGTEQREEIRSEKFREFSGSICLQ